VDDVGGGA
jgi:hypothetical protein